MYVSPAIPTLYKPDIGSNRLRLTIQVAIPTGPISVATENFLSEPVKHFEIIDGLHSHHNWIEAIINRLLGELVAFTGFLSRATIQNIRASPPANKEKKGRKMPADKTGETLNS